MCCNVHISDIFFYLFWHFLTFDVVFWTYPTKSWKRQFMLMLPVFQAKSQNNFAGYVKVAGAGFHIWIKMSPLHLTLSSPPQVPFHNSTDKKSVRKGRVIFISFLEVYVSCWCASSESWKLVCGIHSVGRWIPRWPRALLQRASSCPRVLQCCIHSCIHSGTGRPPNVGGGLKNPHSNENTSFSCRFLFQVTVDEL